MSDLYGVMKVLEKSWQGLPFWLGLEGTWYVLGKPSRSDGSRRVVGKTDD